MKQNSTFNIAIKSDLEFAETNSKAEMESHKNVIRAFRGDITLITDVEAILAEASPVDRIWGIGLDAATASITPVTDWPGENLLGKVLMELREECSGSMVAGSGAEIQKLKKI